MSVYVVAQLSFTNRNAYERYQAGFLDVFRRYGGRLLAADEQPQVIEGRWDQDKIVLLSFPDEATFRRFLDSPEYQAIAQYRKAGAETVVLLARGNPS